MKDKKAMVAWLRECARYFEDRAFWANVANAETAREIAAYFEREPPTQP